MTLKKSLVLSIAAGTTVAGSAAFAQDSLPWREARIDPAGYPASGYQSRAVETVYDCLSSTFGNGSSTHLGTSSMIFEDIGFGNGPWAAATGRIVTEITYGVAVITVPPSDADFLLVFWDEDDYNFQGFGGAGTNMINPAATPIAVVTLQAPALDAGFYWQVTTALTGLPSGGVAVPDGDAGIGLQLAWVNTGFVPTTYQDLSAGIYAGCASTTNLSTVFGSQTGAPLGGNAATPGITAVSYGRDISNATMCANIGQIIGNGGAPVGSGNVEHRSINAAPQRGAMVRMRGDVPPPPEPTNIDLGCLTDAGLTRSTESVGAGQVQWYKVCINGDATDAALKFLDIDTEGSGGDLAIGVYNASGQLIDTDDDSGSGTNAQSSFGVGRRAAVGDGLQYDGRDGQLTAGQYLIAVAPNGSSFGGAYTVAPSANAGGSITVNFATNTVGGALAASVAPLINGVDYGTLDPTLGDTVPGAAAESGLRGVTWHTFTLASPADASHFVDVDFSRLCTPTADTVAYVFNSSGDIVYFSDDEGPNALSQFSLGAAGSRLIGANTVPFDGNTPLGGSGGLPAGQYYVATGLFATQDLGALVSGHRWHVRGTSGSNLTVGFDIYTGSTGPTCGSADFDGDGDTGTDADIEAFFACLGGNCCPTCGTADFDGDGDTGTDADIEAFFRVLGGGNC